MRAGILVIVLVSLADTGCDGDCYDTRHRGFDIPVPTDAELQFRIDRCLVDTETCVELCSLVLMRASTFGEITECDLSMQGSVAHVEVTYDVYIGGTFCGDDLDQPTDF